MTKNPITAPAFQFYAQDFLTGVMYLTNEEIGIYIKMLSKQWTDGKIPKKRLGFLVGFEWVSLSEELRSKFEDCGEYIINKRLEKEREKKSNFHQKQSENGKKGGRPKKDKPNDNADLQTDKNPNETQKKPLEDEIEEEIEIVKEIEEGKEKGGSGEIEVLEYLNLIAGKSFKPIDTNLKFIRARLQNNPIEVLKQVIEVKSYEWKSNIELSKYLRPETLFNATKFESYAQQVIEIKQNPQKFKEHVEQRNTEARKQASKHFDPLDAMPD